MDERQKGIEIHEAHFPGRVPIDSYGAGRFRFAEMMHTGSLICLPTGVYAWDVSDAEQFSAEAFDRVFAEATEIEVLLIGTGRELRPLSDTLREKFRNSGISADAMATGSVVRTYNVLISEGRAVAAAFLAVE